MRISDWSSDVCSSDLVHLRHRVGANAAHARALLGRDDRRGGFLKHFLVPPLKRAVALAEMDRASLAVAEYLKFDVAGVAEIFFHIDGRIAEGGRRFG